MAESKKVKTAITQTEESHSPELSLFPDVQNQNFD